MHAPNDIIIPPQKLTHIKLGNWLAVNEARILSQVATAKKISNKLANRTSMTDSHLSPEPLGLNVVPI